MAIQRLTVKLTELRCIAQSEGSSGSEPYLWTTFFAFGAQPVPFQTGVLGVHTPSFSHIRLEFPDGIIAGRAVPVPLIVASGGFDVDLDSAPQPKLLGVIAVLMEEDSTPESNIEAGRIAYSKAIDAQLQALADVRVRAGDLGPLTDEETDALKAKVKAAVKDAVGRGQKNLGGLFRNQDDNIGFAFKLFTHRAVDPAEQITNQFFDFPEIDNGEGDRFVLSGRIDLSAVVKPTIIRCPAQRAALQAKTDERDGILLHIAALQARLVTASTQAKAGIVALIKQARAEIAAAEAALPALQAALDACLGLPRPKTVGGGVLTKNAIE